MKKTDLATSSRFKSYEIKPSQIKEKFTKSLKESLIGEKVYWWLCERRVFQNVEINIRSIESVTHKVNRWADERKRLFQIEMRWLWV